MKNLSSKRIIIIFNLLKSPDFFEKNIRLTPRRTFSDSSESSFNKKKSKEFSENQLSLRLEMKTELYTVILGVKLS